MSICIVLDWWTFVVLVFVVHICTYNATISHFYIIGVSWDYGFVPEFSEQHLWWLKIPIFEWRSLSHLSHLKIVLGSAYETIAFLIFLFSTCRMFHVFSACLIPSFTRCRHVERSSTMSSQLSMSMAADFISLLQTFLKQRNGQPVLCIPFSSSS